MIQRRWRDWQTTLQWTMSKDYHGLQCSWSELAIACQLHIMYVNKVCSDSVAVVTVVSAGLASSLCQEYKVANSRWVWSHFPTCTHPHHTDDCLPHSPLMPCCLPCTISGHCAVNRNGPCYSGSGFWLPIMTFTTDSRFNQSVISELIFNLQN